jgi:DNA repair and recombination protein RAD52
MATAKKPKVELFEAAEMQPTAKASSAPQAPTRPSPGAELTLEQIEELQKPLDPSRVLRRMGFRGQQLEYLPVHDVIETANRIFGFGGWQREIRRLEKVFEDETDGVYSVGYLCEYRIKVGNIIHEDVGFGASSNQPDPAGAHEMAVKAAVSDALKRCFRAFGDQFGLSLYRKHEVEEAPAGGPRTATEAQVARLRKALRAHGLKESELLDYINAKMGSDYKRLEDLPLKVASRAIDRFTQDADAFVREIKELIAAR